MQKFATFNLILVLLLGQMAFALDLKSILNEELKNQETIYAEISLKGQSKDQSNILDLEEKKEEQFSNEISSENENSLQEQNDLETIVVDLEDKKLLNFKKELNISKKPVTKKVLQFSEEIDSIQ